MTVPELRKQIIARIEPARTANGKPVYCLPDGKIVSKAKKPELAAYLAVLTNEAGRHTASVANDAKLKESERFVERCDNRIRKFAKRRQSPNNVKLVNEWTTKRDAMKKIHGKVAEAA